MSRIVFRWCLVCLLLAAAALSYALTDWDRSPTPSIGGGSYDLGGFVYSWALILLTGSAGVIGLVAGLNVEDRSATRRAFAFAVIALALLVISTFLYGDDLR